MTENRRGLKGRKALVTGGATGIGRAIAERLKSEGIYVTILDKEKIEDGELPFIACDLSNLNEIKETCDQVLEKYGTPDILICNAGQGIHEKLTEGDPEKWSYIIDLNIKGTLGVIRGLVPLMIKSGKPDILFISSVSADKPYPYGGIYSATKTAINQIAETLRLEVQPDARVAVISPGVVDTPFFENMISGEQTPESIGWGALTADELADEVSYVLSRPAGVSLNSITVRPAAQPM